MGDEDQSTQFKLGQWIAKVAVSLVTALTVAAFGLAWNLDRSVFSLESSIKYILERQDGLRQQLKCNMDDSPHPICYRLERLDMAVKKVHGE